MKIVIKSDAAEVYKAMQIARKLTVWDEWYEKLKKIEGKTLEVETKYLFLDQYNTEPVEGVSSSGLRIMEESVERVIDDVRDYFKKCRWCGAVVSIMSKKLCCDHNQLAGFETFENRYRRKEDTIEIVRKINERVQCKYEGG